ncbi:hypothetical protein KY319_01165 [Candidatus Woesearchaeota archaeon]|nr:hypothetical protein [Candidatus Woesearchaeota archaeon]
MNEIVLMSNRLISDLEEKLRSAEEECCCVDEFPAQLKSVFDTAHSELVALDRNAARKYVKTLVSHVNELVDNRVYINADESAEKYANSVRSAFDFVFARFSNLLAKRIKDSAFLDHPVEEDRYARAKEFLQRHRKDFKKASKARNPDELQEFLIRKYEENRNYVAAVDRQRSARASIEKSPMKLPVWVHEKDGKKVCTYLHQAVAEDDCDPVGSFEVRLNTKEFTSVEDIYDADWLKQSNVVLYVVETRSPVVERAESVAAPAPVEKKIEYHRASQPVFRHEKSAFVLLSALKGANDREIAKKYRISNATVQKIREAGGVWTSRFFRKHYPTLDDIAFKEMPGVVSYSKEPIREELISNAIEHLNTDDISYLGLEGAHFGSYLWLSDVFNVDPEKSLVAESSALNCRIMRSIVDNCDAIAPGKNYSKGGKVFKGLNLFNGDICDAVAQSSGKWNLINLDYTGCINDKKLKTLYSLLKNHLIADDAVLFMTLNNSPVFQERVYSGRGLNGPKKSKGYGTRDQVSVVDAFFERQQHGYSVERICSQEYKSKGYDMLFLGYKVKKNE